MKMTYVILVKKKGGNMIILTENHFTFLAQHKVWTKYGQYEKHEQEEQECPKYPH